MYAEKWKIKKCIKPVEPVVEPVEPAIKPVRLKNRFLKHYIHQNGRTGL